MFIHHPSTKKDVFPAFQHSNIIYQYLCHYDSRYVGRTSRWLSDKIKQHVPKCIRTGQFSQDRSALSPSKSSNYSVSHYSRLLVNTSSIISCTHFITITIDSPYFPLVALLSISPLWRLLSLELFNLTSVDKKNSFTALKFFINTLDFDRPFPRPIKSSVSFVDAHRHLNSVWLKWILYTIPNENLHLYSYCGVL